VTVEALGLRWRRWHGRYRAVVGDGEVLRHVWLAPTVTGRKLVVFTDDGEYYRAVAASTDPVSFINAASRKDTASWQKLRAWFEERDNED